MNRFFSPIYRRLPGLLAITLLTAGMIFSWPAMFPETTDHMIPLRNGFALLASDVDDFVTIDPMNFKTWVRRYTSLPAGATQFGSTLLYTPQNDTSLRKIASEFVGYTSFYESGQLYEALVKTQNLSATIKAGTTIVIPHAREPLAPDRRNRYRSPLIYCRGLYLSGHNAGSRNTLRNLAAWRKAGINTIVFDVKDIPGLISYYSHVPEAGATGAHDKRSIEDIGKLIEIYKSHGFYVVARVACFQDHNAARKRPEWAIHTASGGLWRVGNEVWLDPTNRNAQDYTMAIAIEIAEMGVDEVQLDYIRFPTGGNMADARFAWHFGRMGTDDTITMFLEKVHREMLARNTNLSIDIFGVVAWEHERDIMNTGQRIERLARHCEVISPMLYPSHFNSGFDGFAKPGDAPYHFLKKGTDLVSKKAGTDVTIRPWLQAFPWRVSNYNPAYIRQQIRACDDAGALGFLFWNASNNYDIALAGLAPGPTTSRDENQEKKEQADIPDSEKSTDPGKK